MSYSRHIQRAEDLITPQEDTRAGFVAMAVERSRRATPYVAEARALRVSASDSKTANGLLEISAIRSGMVSAAGVSDKAKGHMLEEDKTRAIEELITNHLEAAGTPFIEELVYRYLLTKGDSLGGSMRNVTGSLAGRKLLRAIIAALNLAGIPYVWRHKEKGGWISGLPDDAGVEMEMKSLSWPSPKGSRVLLFNCNVPMVKKNVDMCLMSCDPQACEDAIQDMNAYVALGELKGGIDPAGADEHWKTASTALSRIKLGFKDAKTAPASFFIGAAIVAGMAREIFEQLKSGSLTNAANLTNADHVASICAWLVDL